MKTRTHKYRRGVIGVVIAVIVFCVGVMAFGALMLSRTITVMADATDYVRQTSVERRMLERIVRDAIYAKMEVSLNNSPDSLSAIIDSALAGVNAGGQGVTLTRDTIPASLPSHVFFPDPSTPAMATPDLSSETISYQMMGLVQRGGIKIGAPQVFTFSRNVSGAVTGENRTHRITAQLWSVPLSNWTVHAYGLPGAIPDGAGVASSAPALSPLGARPFVLTTLRPSPAYSPGDPTAYGQLYTPPESGMPETLPAYYRNYAAVSWSVWEYVWGLYVPWLAENSTHAYEFGAYDNGVIPGITENATDDITIDLSTVETGSLSILDSLGGSTVRIVGSASNDSSLVLAIRNATPSRTNVRISGDNARSLILYFNNCNVQCLSNPTWEGGLFIDPYTAITGSMTLNGMIGYGATFAPDWTGFTLTLGTPSAGVYSDMRSVSPRVLLVSTESETL